MQAVISQQWFFLDLELLDVHKFKDQGDEQQWEPRHSTAV